MKKKKQIFPQVEEVFLDGFPKNYRPWPDGWSFTVEDLLEKTADGTFKLLTLDISISDEVYVERVNNGPRKQLSQRAEKEYSCNIGCKYCFECRTITKNLLMTFEEVKGVIKDAKKLGLKSVKFLGPGELLHNPKLFEILDFFEKENVEIGIFTKSVILGDDELAQKIFGLLAKELTQKICWYGCVRLLIGFVSADPATENSRIQTKIQYFSQKRNIGIENVVACGLNKDPFCQRLTLLIAPILKDNIDEVLSIYKWGIMRNIPVVTAPTMVSGKGLDMGEINDKQFKEQTLVDLYANIYGWLISQGIMTLDQIKSEGIAPYAGFACNQSISGMFIRKDGLVQFCPGNESKAFRYAEDVRKSDLKEIWRNSRGYQIRKELVESGEITLTQICYAKTEGPMVARGSISADFYELVLKKLRKNKKN